MLMKQRWRCGRYHVHDCACNNVELYQRNVALNKLEAGIFEVMPKGGSGESGKRSLAG